jgi:hypothetical protein
MNEHDAQKLVEKRLREHADELYVRMLEQHATVLPGNHHPSETLLLAHLMTSVDGYNDVVLHTGDWEKRPKPGFGTVLGYCMPAAKSVVSFVLESHCDNHVRDLAVMIDFNDSNVRTAQKYQTEVALGAIFSSVMVFSPEEIATDPEGCRERIEKRLFDLIEETMVDAGVLQPTN